MTLEELGFGVKHAARCETPPDPRRWQEPAAWIPDPPAPGEGSPRPGRAGFFRRRIAFAAGVTAAALIAGATGQAEEVLRVGTSGDYAPFSVKAPGARADDPLVYGGFDPSLARTYAKDRNLRLRFVKFRWPELLDDLRAGLFDVAMSGITVRPERSLAGNFSVPVATSGAVALVPAASSIRRAGDLDRPGLRIAVNAGGHLERTARQHFPRATIRAIPDNAAVMDDLTEGRADAVITDTQEAPHWRARIAGLRQVGPFTRDRKAWLVGAGRPDLAADLDAWLVDHERSGQMASWRAQYLAEGGEDAGTPRPVLSALLAAIAERLALMPWVAEAKRDSQSPVEVPERERRVIDAALARVRAAEAEADRPPGSRVPADAVRALFGTQIEAAKAIQRRVLAGPRPPGTPTPPALDSALRPALLRIGDRIAWLVVRLPGQIPDAEILARSQGELAPLGLPAPLVDELAKGIMGVQPASAP